MKFKLAIAASCLLFTSLSSYCKTTYPQLIHHQVNPYDIYVRTGRGEQNCGRKKMAENRHSKA
ncbi:hypothetical protein [Saccharobesus litoralis]|uniref:hypothetical protein n=1 Tax=Saccharobesus litoralis TaxID=2172099 RepID=UPI00131EE3E3|nr:hypothetical protein [Saccharobesus litoralis]